MTGTDAAKAQSDRLQRTRSVAVLILVILASLGVVVSLVGAWVRTTLFDTESFMEVVDTTITSEEVIAVVGDAVSDQTINALDIEGRLEPRLATIDDYLSETLGEVLDLSAAQRALLARADLPRFANLAAPIAEPIERQIEEAIDALVASDGFQEQLPQAIAFAHRGAVALIRDDLDDLENVSIVDGEVRWNILPLVEQAIGHVFGEGILDSVVDSLNLSGATYAGAREDALAKLGEALGRVLPDDFGQVTVMSEARLQTWQGLARSIDRTAILAIVLTISLAVIALLLSNNRRRTVVQLAVGSILALLTAAIVRSNVLEALDAAIPGPPEQAAAEVFFNAVSANLQRAGWIFISAAAIVGVAAHLAGRPAWLEALRRSKPGAGLAAKANPVVRAHGDAFIAGGIAAALFVWWQVGINPASLIIVGLLLGAYLWYVSRLVTRDNIAATADGS